MTEPKAEFVQGMRSARYRWVEMLCLYLLLPLSYFFDYPAQIKLGLGLLSLVYLMVVMLKVEKRSLRLEVRRPLRETGYWLRVGICFLLIAACSSFYVLSTRPEKLFAPPQQDLALYIRILFIYSLISVVSQNFVYRVAFFQRYEQLLPNKFALLSINAVFFSLGHLLFNNSLVLVMTLIGGVLYAYTYWKHRSSLLSIFEHSLYGLWLYTVGMGDMLGFPSGE